jgi:hypothetical protein
MAPHGHHDTHPLSREERARGEIMRGVVQAEPERSMAREGRGSREGCGAPGGTGPVLQPGACG